MSPQTTTYESVYDGTLTVLSPSGSVSIEYSPIYYDDDIGFLITHTHKLAQDKPTVTIQIPCEYLCTSTPEDSTKVHMADFCLREFKRYIDALNAELYNRSRPDNESGKYYLHIPNGEILVRNSTYFAMCPQRNYEYGSGSTVYLLPSDYMPSHKMCLCILIQVQLPKHKIRKTIQMLCNDLPRAVKQFIIEFDFTRLESVMKLARKQTSIRMWLKDSDYCAFIANGSILPRSKGTDLPLESATPFKSPLMMRLIFLGYAEWESKKVLQSSQEVVIQGNPHYLIPFPRVFMTMFLVTDVNCASQTKVLSVFLQKMDDVLSVLISLHLSNGFQTEIREVFLPCVRLGPPRRRQILWKR